MENKANLNVRLYNFSEDLACFADIILPISKTEVCGFKVMKELGNGVQVHMPAALGTTWPFSEIAWPAVRSLVTDEYRHYIENLPVKVLLHDIDRNGRCTADITLVASETIINGFLIVPGHGSTTQVHMPAWMHSKWSYPEIQWSDVRSIIANTYLQIVREKATRISETVGAVDPMPKGPVIVFYSERNKQEILADVILKETGARITGIHLASFSPDDSEIIVNMPLSMNRQWTVNEITWDDCSAIVRQEYYRQVCGRNLKDSDVMEVVFNQPRKVYSCLADITLPNRNTMKGFILKRIGSGNLMVSAPKWMGYWSDKKYSWTLMCELISKAHQEHLGQGSSQSGLTELPQANRNIGQTEDDALQDHTPQTSSLGLQQGTKAKEKTGAGRIINAENSSLKFYPRTVLRLADNDKADEPKKRIYDLVVALNKGSLGGFGPFEVNILLWIAQLRYVTKTMLLDLVEHGYVSSGWRTAITSNKLTPILNRMERYDLINLTRFVTVDDEGNSSADMRSTMRITTLGKAGNTLLHELGKKVGKYNPFDIMQDGNTVKKILAANQWLIYWLTEHKEQIGEEYEPSYTLYQKGFEYSGARIYASVTVNNHPIIVEPIRCVEDFEAEDSKTDLREKIVRLIKLYSDLDHLYNGQESINFSQRPIITLMCEDDEHMQEVWASIEDIANAHPEQKIWFTSDLRIFNHNMAGQRFGQFYDGNYGVVNLQDELDISSSVVPE